MVSRRFQLTTIGLTVVLAAECMLTGVAHRHCHSVQSGDPGPAACDDAGACHDVRSASAETSTPPTAPHAPGQAPSRHDPGDCLACQYLAKHALPVILVASFCVAQLTDLVVWSDAVSGGSCDISLPLSRGPPALV